MFPCWRPPARSQTAADALGELEDLREQLAAAQASKSLAEREVQRAMDQLSKLRAKHRQQEAETAEVCGEMNWICV